MVIKFYPFIPLHRPQPHSNIIRPMSERSVGERFRLVHIPFGIGTCRGSFEVNNSPFARLPFGSFERGAGSRGRLFRIG